MLVVDDNHLNIIALSCVINQFGIHPDLVGDGIEAIELVKHRLESKQPMYKLILIDYCMPLLDAPSTILRIKELMQIHNIETQPRISCVTAYNQKEFKARAREVGMDDFLLKPLEASEMEAQLRKSGILKKKK